MKTAIEVFFIRANFHQKIPVLKPLMCLQELLWPPLMSYGLINLLNTTLCSNLNISVNTLYSYQYAECKDPGLIRELI